MDKKTYLNQDVEKKKKEEENKDKLKKEIKTVKCLFYGLLLFTGIYLIISTETSFNLIYTPIRIQIFLLNNVLIAFLLGGNLILLFLYIKLIKKEGIK